MKKLLFTIALLSNLGRLSAQTQAQPLLVTNIFGINSSWPGECSAGVIDNRSQVSRQNDYHAVSVATGSGNWTVAINFSDTACTGPWSSFGSTSSINQAAAVPIAFGIGNHQFIQIVITGNPVVTYSGSKNYFLSTVVGSISFPITFAQGGTGLGSAAANTTLISTGSAWTATAVPNCQDSGGNHLNFNTSTSLFSCGTSSSGGSTAFSAITSATNTNHLTMGTGGTFDSSGSAVLNWGTAGHTTPTVVVANSGLLPATCGPGELGFVTGSTAGQNIWECQSANTWTQQLNGGGGASLPSATVQTTFLQVSPNSSNLTTFRWDALPTLNPVDYQYTQTPGGSLTGGGGSQSITLTPCPLGIFNATNGWAPVYISGGTGTAEAKTPSGGTCSGVTAGITAGTIVVSPTNNHTGAWTVQSATLGIFEAENFAAGPVHIVVPPMTGTIHSTITLPFSTWIDGSGRYSTIFNIDSAMTAVDVFHFNGGSGKIGKISEVEILYPGAFTPATGGNAIQFSDADTTAEKVIISGGGNYSADIGILCSGGSGICRTSDVDVYEHKSHGFETDGFYAFWFHDTAVCGNPNQCISGFHITGGGQQFLRDDFTEEGQYGVFVDIKTAANPISDSYFVDTIVDNATSNGFFFQCSAACTAGGDRIDIRGGQIATAAGGTANGVYIASGGVANAWTDINIADFETIAWAGSGSGIRIQGLNHGKIYNNNIGSGDNTAGTGIQIDASVSKDIDITGNSIIAYPTVGVGTTCAFQAILVDAQAHSGIYVDGNKLCAGSATFTDTNTTGALLVSQNNSLTLGPPTIASAGTLPIPPDALFYVSGNTAVTAVSQLAANRSRNFTFIATNVGPGAWTAGATIGNSFTPVQNVPVNCYWDATGGKVYCK